MDMPLLATKLTPPPLRPERVARPRLARRLDEGSVAGLTLVSAPAGFGKTTLVAEWLAGRDLPAAWLSLDEGDNDPARFFAYLLAACRRIWPDVGQAAQALAQAPQPPPAEALLTILINDLTMIPQSFVLVLDDYHVIHSLPIHQQLGFLLERRPPQMRLVIATREDPPLPLARLRARGQIVEIRQADLSFSMEEAAAFLRRAAPVHLAAADVAALHERTEGWIAGLQLAALCLASPGMASPGMASPGMASPGMASPGMAGQVDAHRIVASFTGSHRFVLDYLLEEAFQRQPPEVRDFLLHTAILERLCGPLCDAVLRIGESANQQIGKSANREPTDSPFADSQAVLEYLDRANLFIIPLDPERGWYRYHHLFAELLRHRLQTTAGEQAGLLHRRASAWYAAHGFPAEAVQHALAGQDWAQAATLIQDSSDALLKRGEVVTVLGWLRALPDDWVRSRPQFCLTCSWALILTGQLDIAEVYLGQAEETSQNDPAFLRDILSLQASIARARGDNRRTIEIAERTLALVPPDAFAERGVAALNLGLAQWNRGDLAGAEQALVEAERAAHQAGVDYPRLIALTFLGIIQASWGKLRQAAALFERTIQSAGDSPAGALAHLELAALLYEWNELGAAADHLQRGLELSQRGGNVEVEIGGLRTLARLRQAQGDAAAALEMLERVHQFTRDHYLAPIMRARDAACHVQIALTQNDLSAAIRWAEQMTEDADSNPFYPLLGLTAARLLLAQNQKAAAAQKLMELYEIAERAGWSYGALATRVWQALAAETAETALGFLTDALKRGQPEHFIRTFADAGQASVPLLQEAARRGVTPEYVGQLLAAIGAQSGPAADRAPGLIEPLSERELEVLRLLTAGLSNRAIAAKLILSEGTVKTHIHNLSGKLAAANRTEAAARARELRLI